MKPRQQVSRAALELIKTFEGYRQKSAQLADGRWTIGYGHTLTARDGAEVSAADAEALLLYDLIAIAHTVNENVYTPLTQNQFDGLACFAFNVGVENFKRSTVLRRVNEGNLLQAAYAMEMWRRADFEGERIVIDALVRRRSAEKTLFLTPPGGWTPAPSPVLPPKIDFEIEPFSPREKPTAVRTSMTGPMAVAEREDGEPVAAEPAEPTASEQAAAEVAARLETLLPDPEPFPAEPVAIQPEAEPEPAPVETIAPRVEDTPAPTRAEAWTAPTLTALDVFTLTPPAEQAEPKPVAEAQSSQAESPSGPSLFDMAPRAPAEQAGGFAPPPRVQVEDERAPDNIVTSFDPAFSLERAEPGGFTGGPLVVLALVGLVVFAGGVFWGLNAAPDAAGGMPVAKTVGWGLGVVGVLCFGVAAYGLLRQLGGDDELED